MGLVGDFGERTDGLIVGLVDEEDLGDPKRYVLLVVLHLNVFLEILETVLNEQVSLVRGSSLFLFLFLAAEFAADVH